MKILVDGQTFHTPDISRGIGVYIKNILEKIFFYDPIHEYYINVSDPSVLNILSPWAQERLHFITHDNYNPEHAMKEKHNTYTTLYTKQLIKDIKKHSIDLYWNPNPLVTTVYHPNETLSIPYIATIYDIIPLVMKERYVKEWHKHITKDYKTRLSYIDKNAAKLFHISESTKNDFVDNFPNCKAEHIVTHLAPQSFFEAYPFPVDSAEKYLVYQGGFDPRKNMYGAVKGFAKLLKKYKNYSSYRLYIVCHSTEKSEKNLMDFAEKEGVKKNIVVTGYISDKKLLKLYQKARCLFYPSLYEGFGLPVIEALACGIPVACSNSSSLPEIGKDQAEYFDPNNPTDMAEKLHKTIQKSTDYKERFKRSEYAKKFNWDKTALQLVESFKSIKKICNNDTKNKKKIAWVSPFPPQKSGIATYSRYLVKTLSKKVDIDLYYDKNKPAKHLASNFNCIPLSKLPDNFSQYDDVIYHLGNSDFHTNIYKIAWNYPGTIVLHDYNIQPFISHVFYNSKDDKYFYNAYTEGYGYSKNEIIQKTKETIPPDLANLSLSDAIVKRSKKVIVHHRWVKKQFKENNHIFVTRQFSYLDNTPSKKDLFNFKKEFDITDKDIVISILGFINWNKLPEYSIQAIFQLIDEGFPIKFVLAGELADNQKHLVEMVDKNPFKKNIVFTGYLNDKKYKSAIFVSDMIINLRNPSMGEASATLMQSLFAGKPTIISNINQYKEFPDSVCAKLDHDSNEVENLIKIIKNILLNEDVKINYIESIKKFIDQYKIEQVKNDYLNVIQGN